MPIVGGNFVSALNELDRAWFSVEMNADLRLEYLAPVKVDIDGHPMIEGSVVAAFPQGAMVEIHIQSAIAMTEEKMHGMVAQEFGPQDIAYAIARRSGFEDEKIVIHELDDLPHEVFEVVVGIDGIEAQLPMRIGAVTFVAPEQGRRILDQFDPQPEWAGEFEDAPSHAVVYTTTQRMHNAQVEALGEIDWALSWLAIRTRYGLSHLPDGTLHRYDRSESNATPSRRDLVALRGLQTGRRWIQRLGPRLRASALNLGARSRLEEPSLPRDLPFEIRQAMLSAGRALSDEDPIQRSQALWESLEFYMAGRASERLFSPSERKELLSCLRAAVSKDQHQRVADLLNWIDQPPPKAALRRAIDEEGVPVTESEFGLLFKIRTARNKATHGGEVEIPSDQDLDYACSILSRILVYRVDALGVAP
ncbi:MAG TPA: hypothetical protein VNM38_00525 [Solirubrobacterales bacterium]|nr:hypothetical protein [Solirubrobacterales bacterium]